MSLTTESSLQRRDRRCWTCKTCWRFLCPCVRRKVAPVSPQPANAEFMTLGTKGKRVLCVVHVDPCLPLPMTGPLASFAKRIEISEPEGDGYQSDSSDHDYWFTKWSKPLRTVRKLQQAESASKQEEAAKTKESNVSQLEPVPVKFSQDSGMVNLAFDGSPTDPEATQSTTTMQQAITASSSASKPLLYFIHGAGESSESWRRVMQFFSGRQYEVLALDLLGHGFSGTPRSGKCYTFAKLLGDVAAVFDAHVSEGRKAVLIGHGYGCSLAVALSRQRSSNVALLALLSSGGPTPLAPPISSRGREWKLPRSLLRCLKSLLPCGIRRAVFYGARGKSCIHENGPLQSLPSYVRHHLGAGQSWPEGDVAFHRKVSVPTLLVHGLKDRFVSLVEMCEMERTIPRAFLEVIPESGHEIQVDAPDELCKMLLKFVEHWQR